MKRDSSLVESRDEDPEIVHSDPRQQTFGQPPGVNVTVLTAPVVAFDGSTTNGW